MKRLLAIALLLIATVQGAWSQTPGYNAIATAYVTTTISQSVVFDSNMQQGGTFNFSVLAHNGGGRAGQSDTANVRIQFFNASGAQVGATAQTNYSGNLPNPNAVCGNPCIDPAVPWTTLSVNATLSAADAANVAYAKISMYGIDGSYWAGDYGPWYRAPTFTLDGGNNLAYNPEFGPYNGITAQGWVSSPGFGACQGAWGGSNACIVNDQGVPGTSTTGLVANANGGGPSATGGTTSGQPGGYNSTMSVTNAGAGTGQTTSAPTVVSTSTSNSTSQSVSYGSPSVAGSTPIYQPVMGYDIYGNSVVIYYQNINEIIGTPVTTTITTRPVTTTNYSDGTSTTTNGTPTSTSTTTTQFSTNIVPGAAPTIVESSVANSIFIDQIGAGNSVTINQTGNKNRVQGVNQQDAVIRGDYNTVGITQGGFNNGPNRVDLYLSGSFNNVTASQGVNTSLNSASGHYQELSITGVGNTVNTSQSNNGTGSHYMTTTVNGNNNTVNANQYNNNTKSLTNTVTGSNNTVTATQSGTGQHSLETTLLGNGNSATVTQTGPYANSASITLQNAGGTSSATLIQNGNTGSNAYSLQQICVNPAGCSVSVTQIK
jgi:hypothetical protein